MEENNKQLEMTSVTNMGRTQQEQHQREKPWRGFGFSHKLHIDMVENFNKNDSLYSQGNNSAIVFNYYDVSAIDHEFYLKMFVNVFFWCSARVHSQII